MKDIAEQAANLRRRLSEAQQKETMEMAKVTTKNENQGSTGTSTGKKTSTKPAEKKSPGDTKKAGGAVGGPIPDGHVGIEQIAEEFGLTPRAVRNKLRSSDVPKPDGFRYAWKEGSKELKAAKALFAKG